MYIFFFNDTATTEIYTLSLHDALPIFAERGRIDHSPGIRDLLEKVLLPSFKEGQIVVMDNLSAHRPKRIRELIEQHGCELLYLPAYSPDLNPIEEAFAKIKNLLRNAAARSKETLVEAIGAALSAVTVADVRGFFEHAGYRLTAHLP